MSAASSALDPGLERRLVEDRERFVAFAFAGADLLLEATADGGRITFAAGAFRTRLGRDAEAFVGQPAAEVFAAEDRPAFEACVGLLVLRGRLAPTALRLADGSGTPCVLSGLARPVAGGGRRLCLTLAPHPGSLPAAVALVLSPAALGREAEVRLRSAARAQPSANGSAPATMGELAFLEVRSGDGTAVPGAEVAAALLDCAGAGAIAGELSPGRFGVLRPGSGAEGLDPALRAAFNSALRAGGLHCHVESAVALPLADPASVGLTTGQAVRALRHALATFARDGTTALTDAGLLEGMSGFVTAAGSRVGALRRLLAGGHFRLAYQPIVRLGDRTIHHYEALLRPGPLTDGGAQAGPAEVVALAEAVGLTAELDWAVFEQARKAAARTGQAIAFNLSGLSVQCPDFRARLLKAIDQGPPPGTALAPRLLAEVTETAEIEDEAAAAATIDALRERRIPVCLDDFGAGSAAFRYLRRFRVDHVKIDGSYVRRAAEDARDRGFVAAMVDLSVASGATAIAEQVETEAVAEVMGVLGVQLGQGWLYGAPADLPERAAAAPVSVARRRGVAKEEWG